MYVNFLNILNILRHLKNYILDASVMFYDHNPLEAEAGVLQSSMLAWALYQRPCLSKHIPPKESILELGSYSSVVGRALT